MQTYLDLLDNLLTKGVHKKDRTHTGVLSLFGEKMTFDLTAGFPLMTTKKMYVKAIIAELLWFIRGDTNLKFLHAHKCHIWDEWADEQGNLGPIYGKQWRAWEGRDGTYDQLSNLMWQLKHNPDSRRLIINAWNVADLPAENISPSLNAKQNKMALAPCHVLAQFYVLDKKLSCQVYLRSQDFFLGTPFNIASYAFLTFMIADQLSLVADKLIWIAGDTHLYLNHLDQAKQQIKRKPYPLAQLTFKRKVADIFSYTVDDFILDNYQFHPTIKAPISI